MALERILYSVEIDVDFKDLEALKKKLAEIGGLAGGMATKTQRGAQSTLGAFDKMDEKLKQINAEIAKYKQQIEFFKNQRAFDTANVASYNQQIRETARLIREAVAEEKKLAAERAKLKQQYDQNTGAIQKLIDKERELRQMQRDARSRKEIALINKELEKTVRLREKLESIGQSRPSPFSNLVKSAVQFALTISIVNASLNALRRGLELGLEIEKTITGFRVLSGSIKEADRLLNEIQKYAAQTPFEFPELAKTAKTLLAYGVETDKVIQTLKRLGDIASISGNELGQIANIFGQVKAAGRLTTQELNQFTQAGIPVLEAMREETGLTNLEIRKLAEKGLISFSTLENAIIRLTGPSGKFFLGTSEQAKTLGGRLSTLRDEINLRFLEAFDKLRPTFLKLTIVTTELLKGMAGFSNVLFNLPLIINTLTPYVISLGSALVGLNLPLVISRFTILAGVLRTTLVNAFRAANTAVVSFNLSLLTTTGFIGALIAAVGLLTGAIIHARNTQRDYNQTLEEEATLINAVNEEISKETQKSRELFNILKDENAVREEKIAAMNRLRALYPDLISKTLSEASSLSQVADAQRDLNNALSAGLRLRGFQRAMEASEQNIDEVVNTIKSRASKITRGGLGNIGVNNVADNLGSSLKAANAAAAKIASYSGLKLNEAQRADLARARADYERNAAAFRLAQQALATEDRRGLLGKYLPILTKPFSSTAHVTSGNLAAGLKLQPFPFFEAQELNATEDLSDALDKKEKKSKAAAKAHEFHRDAVEADTRSIEEQILTLQRQQESIQQDAAIFRAESSRDASRTSVELLKLKKDATEVRQGVVDAISDSRRKLSDDVKQTTKQLQDALRDDRITKERFNAEMSKLAAEAAAAEVVINKVALEANLEADRRILHERIRAFEEFAIEREQKTLEHEEKIRDAVLEGHKFVLDTVVGNFTARRFSAEASYKRESQIVAEANRLRESQMQDLNNRMLVAQMQFEAADEDLKRDALEKEIEAIYAEMQEIETANDLSRQRLLSAYRTYQHELTQIEREENEKRLEEEESRRNRYLQGIIRANEVATSAIGGSSARLAEAITDLATHQDTASLKRVKQLQKELEIIDRLIDKYKEFAKLTPQQQAELEALNKKRQETASQIEEEDKINRAQRREKIIDFGKALGDVALSELKANAELELKLTDRLIAAQQKKVDSTRQLLDRDLANRKGVTAEQLQLEEERADRLREIKRREVEQQRQLSLLEITFNSAVAVAKAAASGGPLAAITIGSVLSALATGFASSRRNAIEAMPGFRKGGYTGNVGTDDVAGVVHGKEFVVDAKTTKLYRKELEMLQKGASLLPTGRLYQYMLAQGSMLQLRDIDTAGHFNAFGTLIEEIRETNRHLRAQKQEIILDANGVYHAMAEVERSENASRKHGQY